MLPKLEIRGVRRISKQADLEEDNLSAARYTLSRLFRMLAYSSLESPRSTDRDNSSRYRIPHEPVTNPVDIQLDNQSLQGRNARPD